MTQLLTTIRREIERLKSISCTTSNGVPYINADTVLFFLDTLEQQKQDVDLEKELENFVKSEIPYGKGGYGDMLTIATHFYELGKNSK